MSIATTISIDEYLATHYRPDCDYVDGEVLDRNVGEREHSFTQQRLMRKFFALMDGNVDVSIWPEVRIQVSATRFRVPDLCVYRGAGPRDRVFHQPPFLCIEILSPEDRMSRMEDKLDDYFRFGVEIVWVIDPVRRTASIHTPTGSRPVRDGSLRTSNPDIEIPLPEIFSGLE